jgi:hypothetical protein
VDLFLQHLHGIHRAVNGCRPLSGLPLPPRDALNLSRLPALLSVDLLAQLALGLHRHRLHDELHTTRFARAVLAVAVLPEVAPFPVTTLEPVLIKEAHDLGMGQLRRRLSAGPRNLRQRSYVAAVWCSASGRVPVIYVSLKVTQRPSHGPRS